MSNRERPVGMSATNSMELAPAQLGASGAHGAFVIVPVFQGEEAADERRTQILRNETSYVLSSFYAKFPRTPINGAFTANHGGSLLSLPAGATALAVNTSRGSFTGESNLAKE